MAKEALIIVDVQNDFCPDGSLAVPKGNEVVKPINSMMQEARRAGNLVVATRDWHPKNTGKHFKTWSAHCVQDTKGAEFHPDLHLERVTVVGLALDYCVQQTALDALKRGFPTTVVLEGTKAVNIKPDDGKGAIDAMARAGAKIIG